MTESTILFVYQGEWGLPSIDFDCLRALCAVKFTRAPIAINTKGNPFRSGDGRLPYIQAYKRKIVGYEQIISYLQEQGYTVNDQLPRNVSNLAEAYESLVFNDLHPYFQYFMFGSPDNIDQSRKLYANRTPFPLNFYYPAKYMKHADEVMQVFGGFSVHDKIEDHSTEMIIINAKKCVNLLSSKLGKNKYFFGQHYSSLDILVYAYLAILYNITLPNNPLQVHLQECPNLVKFIDRITKQHFAAEAYSSKDAKQKVDGNSTATLTPSEQEFAKTKRKTQILATLFAVVAMTAYATWMGIVKINADSYYDDLGYRDDDDGDEG